jgi:hypothetical protein
MRRELAFLCLVIALIRPAVTLGQSAPTPVRVQLAAHISDYRYERGTEARWRAASGLRLRLLVHDRFLAEFSSTAPFASEGRITCPPGGSCPPSLVNNQIAWRFNELLGSIGYRIPMGAWIPYVGVGTGRLRTGGEGFWSWVGSAGVEQKLSDRAGMLLEYRLHRVDWGSEGIGWNHEMGVGVSFIVS